MKFRVPIFTFVIAFAVFQLWGAYWIVPCLSPQGEECLGAGIILTYTGLPFTIMGSGNIAVSDLVTLSILGGLQWGFITALIVSSIFLRKAASNQSLESDN